MRLRRASIAIGIGVGAILLVAWPNILAFLYGARKDNVTTLYAVRGEVRPGMPRDALNAAVARTKPPIRTLWKSREELLVSVPVGFMESVYLQVFLAGDAVSHARIRGDSGEIIAGAPPDF